MLKIPKTAGGYWRLAAATGRTSAVRAKTTRPTDLPVHTVRRGGPTIRSGRILAQVMGKPLKRS